MNRRTVRSFPFGGDPGDIVDAWARENQFVMTESTATARTYRRSWIWSAARAYIRIAREGDMITVEAWVKPGLNKFIQCVINNTWEYDVESIGMLTSIESLPRNEMRKLTNVLLQKLSQPAIP